MEVALLEAQRPLLSAFHVGRASLRRQADVMEVGAAHLRAADLQIAEIGVVDLAVPEVHILEPRMVQVRVVEGKLGHRDVVKALALGKTVVEEGP